MTSINANDLLKTLGATYGAALRASFENRAKTALAQDPSGPGIIATMLSWLDASISEVLPGPVSLQIQCAGGGGAKPSGVTQFAGGFGTQPNTFGVNPMMAAAAGSSNAGSVPPNGAVEMSGLGVTARVPSSVQVPPGAKCGIMFSKKGFDGKFYCTKTPETQNNNLFIWTCNAHKNNKTTGSPNNKSGTKISPVIAASQINGMNNGQFAPQGFHPTTEQINTIGGAMRQTPNFAIPPQQQPITGFGAPTPQPVSNVELSNALIGNVQPQLTSMQPQQQLNPQTPQQFQPGNQFAAPQQGLSAPQFGVNPIQQHAPQFQPGQQVIQPVQQQGQQQPPQQVQFNPIQGAPQFQPTPPQQQQQQQTPQFKPPSNDDDEENETNDDDDDNSGDDEDDEEENKNRFAVQQALVASQKSSAPTPQFQPQQQIPQQQNTPVQTAINNAQPPPAQQQTQAQPAPAGNSSMQALMANALSK